MSSILDNILNTKYSSILIYGGFYIRIFVTKVHCYLIDSNYFLYPDHTNCSVMPRTMNTQQRVRQESFNSDW